MKPQSLSLMCATLGMLILSGCAAWEGAHPQQLMVGPADVPVALHVGAEQMLTVTANAIGVQIYTCSTDQNNPAAYVWNFKSPEANLFNTEGKKMGKHYAGPTWEGSDGSQVVGQLKASDRGPDVHAIPWLLLNAKSNSGDGIFTKTRFIQRLNTSGGIAPTDGCDAAHAGNEVRVPYTAQYYFYN